MKVIVYGWEKGMNKVQFTKYQNSFLKISLKNSKQNTLDVLDEKEIVYLFDNENEMQEFIQKIVELKVKFRIEN